LSRIAGEDKNREKGQRIPAISLEAIVKGRLREFLADPAEVLGAIQELASNATEQRHLIDNAAECAATLSESGTEKLRTFFLAVVSRIQVHAETIEIALATSGLMRWLASSSVEQTSTLKGETEHARTVLTIPARLTRTGQEMRFVVSGAAREAPADASLTRIMVRAHAIRDRLFRDGNLTIEEVAREEELVPSYVTRLLRLTFLAPDIVSSIVAGRQPPELTANKLMADTRLPLAWSEQRIQLGFA